MNWRGLWRVEGCWLAACSIGYALYRLWAGFYWPVCVLEMILMWHLLGVAQGATELKRFNLREERKDVWK